MEGFFVLLVWRGLYMEGLIFGILRQFISGKNSKNGCKEIFYFTVYFVDNLWQRKTFEDLGILRIQAQRVILQIWETKELWIVKLTLATRVA